MGSKVALGKVDTGSCHRSFTQSDRTYHSHGVGRITQMDNSRCRSKNTQISASVNDSAFNAVFLQGVDSPIDCKSLGNSAKINNQRPTEEHPAILAKENVTPRSGTIGLVTKA